MDIEKYQKVYKGLVDYNKATKPNYGNTVLDQPPFWGEQEELTYPMTIFEEIRNVATSFDFMHERVASVGYRVDILSKDKAKVNKQQIARELAQMVNNYLSKQGLSRVSYNSDVLFDGTTYHIVMTFSGNLSENRGKFI